ncbi:flavin reductase [Achromobacter arsenitoxydans]|uniref:Flavin reductase-like protein n=1 Tax=Achromobacter arsenitoxydans SY8 TaxID=477184 RepID=H0F0Y7_9BURK|nr:flavin reductase [Achromobacter arsenitoxydans]EHK68025.1 flavin reductase-like protein [Achromobacter arsenitoxydans SY8]
MTPFDSREFRRALGAFPTGVTVITTCDAGGKPYGVTANSFSSVSLDPPLILWSQSTTSSSYPAFRDCDRFVVNILADHQVHVSNQFAKSGADKFREVPVTAGLGGVPVIDDCAAHLECVKVAAYPGGDHVVYLGQVEKIFRSGHHSLAFGDGKYLRTYAHDLGEVGSQTGAAGLDSLKAQRMALAALPDICERIGQRTVGIAVWGNQGATIIGWEPSTHPVSPYLQAGVVVSLTQSATGIAFAAFMPPGQTQAAIDEELQARVRSGQPDTGQFAQRVAETLHHGLARAVGAAASPRHQVKVNAFSAPVYDASGNMVLAISTTCEAERLAPDWDGPVPAALREAARELSLRLGYPAGASLLAG